MCFSGWFWGTFSLKPLTYSLYLLKYVCCVCVWVCTHQQDWIKHIVVQWRLLKSSVSTYPFACAVNHVGHRELVDGHGRGLSQFRQCLCDVTVLYRQKHRYTVDVMDWDTLVIHDKLHSYPQTFHLLFHWVPAQNFFCGFLSTAQFEELREEIPWWTTPHHITPLSLNSQNHLYVGRILPSKHWGLSAFRTLTDQWGAWSGSKSLRETKITSFR